MTMDTWAVPSTPVRVHSNGNLIRVSRQSCLSANDKGINGVKAETVHRSLGLYLTNEEGNRVEAVRQVIA